MFIASEFNVIEQEFSEVEYCTIIAY